LFYLVCGGGVGGGIGKRCSRSGRCDTVDRRLPGGHFSDGWVTWASPTVVVAGARTAMALAVAVFATVLAAGASASANLHVVTR
jgi:hypothetical protein